MNAPRRFTLPCPWCDYYVDAAQESGAGEAAASMMTDHLMAAHPGKNWMQYLAASANRSVSPQPENAKSEPTKGA